MSRIVPKLNGEKICNFDIETHRLVNVRTDTQEESDLRVELSAIFEDGSSTEIQRVALSKLASFDWGSLDYRACFNVAAATAKRQIANDIRSSLGNIPRADVYRLSHPGAYKINGEPVFCTGSEVIRPSSKAEQGPEIELGPMTQSLDTDLSLSEDESATEMLNLISLFPDPGRIILSQILVSLLRQAYEDAGKRPAFCIFLYGRSGTQKTSVSIFLTQLYNRSEGIAEPPRLNGSQASAVEILMESADQVKVFDDLFPADSNQVRRKQEETLAEITRYIGDGSIPTRMKGGKVCGGRPKCGVLFTGEYIIGEGSDAARLLPVEMTKPDTSKLSYFQSRPLTVSTFYRNFITWVINDYDNVVSYLTEWLSEYGKIHLCVHDRLRKAHFFLNTAYALFLEYCIEKSVLSENEASRLHRNFLSLLSKLIQKQNQRVYPVAPASTIQGNVLARIRELYRSNQFTIPDNKRYFKEDLHDGIKHKGCLCLRPKALSRFFPDNNIEDVAAELDAQDALIKGTDGLKKKLSTARGKYFYCIQLKFL